MRERNADFEAIAKQVYDDFLVSLPTVAVEGLFAYEGRYFIVSPALGTRRADGLTVGEWFDTHRRPLGHPISLVERRPEGAYEVRPRRADDVRAGYGVVRTVHDIVRDLSVRLPATIPIASVFVDEPYLVINVSRQLADAERVLVESTVAATGQPLALDIRVAATEAVANERALKTKTMDLAPARLRRGLPGSVQRFLEEDEDCWRDHFGAAWTGDLTNEQILGDRRLAHESACLVGTTFPPNNIRTYLSLYQHLLIALPLEDRLEETFKALGVSRKELIELVERRKVSFVAPQSVDRYDADFLANVVEARTSAVTGSRRLAAAVHADQALRNPLLVLPGTALQRRAVLRALQRMGENQPHASSLFLALADGLAEAWPVYEQSLHARGAMTSLTGPLAQVSQALAQRMTGKDLFIELGAAAQHIEWASAFGAHFAPYQSSGYSELGHAELLVAIHGGLRRDSVPVARAAQFEVAEDLLVIDSDVDVIDFVTAIGKGDIARLGHLVRSIARPDRTEEEIRDLVAMWNREVREYERRPDRLKSMGLGGFLLGGAAKIAGAPDAVSVSAALLPAVLTYAQEDVVGQSAGVGEMLDTLNARLASVQRDAVLLARMRKLVKGMK